MNNKLKIQNEIMAEEDLKIFKSIDDPTPIIKKPKQPYKPTKPWVPQKKIPQGHRIELDQTTTLASIIEELPKEINYSDVSVVVHEENDCYSGDSYKTVYLEYFTEIDNPNYEYHMENYNKSNKSYLEKMKKFKPKYEAYLKEKEVYDVWHKEKMKVVHAKFKEQEIKELEARLNKLKKK